MTKFFEDLEKTQNVSVTENGAIGYKSTKSFILDTSFNIPKMRGFSKDGLCNIWNRCYSEDYLTAILFMFYVGDIREGLGERNTFRTFFKEFCMNNPKEAVKLLSLVPVYSRWDILWDLLDIDEISDELASFVKSTIHDDINNMNHGQPITLLAKWMPSYNTSSKETRAKAVKLAKMVFGYDLNDPAAQKLYRKVLSNLRKYLKVTERQMSANEWSEIDYSAVPSKAALRYKNAFAKRDGARYMQFISMVNEGWEKINTSVTWPSEVVQKYYQQNGDGWYRELRGEPDEVLETIWKSLPLYDNRNSNTICVVDTSGSMTSHIPGAGSLECCMVANALAIYFADHSTGNMKDQFITFASSPKIVSFKGCNSLFDKLNKIAKHSLVDNTNIEAVFDLILDTAIENKYQQSDLPDRILILSDMEFDYAQDYNNHCSRALFDELAQRYSAHGYKLPTLVFWNLNSRTSTIPMISNDLGVILVSGFSPNILKMVLGNETDPYKALMSALYSERYLPIAEALDKE